MNQDFEDKEFMNQDFKDFDCKECGVGNPYSVMTIREQDPQHETPHATSDTAATELAANDQELQEVIDEIANALAGSRVYGPIETPVMQVPPLETPVLEERRSATSCRP